MVGGSGVPERSMEATVTAWISGSTVGGARVVVLPRPQPAAPGEGRDSGHTAYWGSLASTSHKTTVPGQDRHTGHLVL